jgi:2-polyprenyl-6-methoxyphenol hydroxylase-like FAD-dependent oxidoreductase
LSDNLYHTHAIVIGGSMAGLLAARALSNHFDRVTLIERDTLPDGPEFRNGVPQAHHLHVILAQGRKILLEMLPELADDLTAIGSPQVDLGLDACGLAVGGWSKRVKSGLITNLCSRVALEWIVRHRLSMFDNIHFLSESQVESLVTSADRKTVTGVVVLSRRDQSTQTLEADLVVDASGRGSKAPEWLESLGYQKPTETIVNPFLGYATRWYEPPANFRYNWKFMLLGARPQQGIMRGGAIVLLEGNRWAVTLAGTNKDYPPTDETGFMAFAKSLPAPELYEALKDAKPISPVYGYRRTENRWRHFEHLERTPERFIVMGDAYCAFNPIYGQGMTVAAMEAHALDEMLNQHILDGFATRFHQHLPKVVENAWLLATGEDLRYPLTEGERPGKITRFIQKYIDRMIEILPYSAELGVAFLQTTNLTRPPTSLLHPRFFFTVLRYQLLGFEKDNQDNAPVQGYTEAVPLTESQAI